ncbi:spore germination protein KB [Paenibacillus forsythiae]|uniref:Spore germination protein KB n=1 Tax=Paenibacillus forsythiae TaxID=365616 RepID=A0ABU3H380_9BACL|nr:endospore germination permease [Paenibacillus forsythiae]MDT3424921.1 spore germination protein KB [Paenibacillus forsythiae]
MDNNLRQQISTRQLSLLVIYSIVGDMLLILPTIVSTVAGHASWISAFAAIPFGILVLWLFYALSRLYPDGTLMEIIRSIFGKWLGPVICVWYLAYFLLGSALYMREVADFIKTHILTDTPMRVIIILATITTTYALMKGLEPIARSAEIFFFIFMAALLSMLVLAIKDFDLANIRPFSGKGAMGIAEGGFFSVGYSFGELCMLMMIFPFVRHRSHTRRDLLLSGLIGGTMLASVVLWCLLVLGGYYTSTELFPSYILAQTINIGNFLERVEVILAVNWMFGIFFKCTLSYFAFLTGLSRLTGMRGAKPLILPGAFLLFGLSYLISPNIVYYTFTMKNYYLYWDITNGILLPLILLTVGLMRRKKVPKPA